ncbi:ArsR/SmtB family transcription factor [Streptococcus tangpeifui]|uniref:Transcriptional regulator, ArsR family n=1 Tax=Streptococcus criceti HS-6 TaxID=873449 RepID=G5JTG6_STRCG|nr:helix-turn-helix transcriptional regulator [Streptococcus criceti]EHI74146.1 transcriptional regulator, ArsR family [Streptococcus criceti HS-6]SUN43602.1 transcriptional regulator [Streptococcus criceti]
MKNLSHPATADIKLEQILYALSEPIRLAIFRELYKSNKERNCSYFSDLGKKNNLSHHYKMLRENGLIRVRIDGRQRFISLRLDELNERFPGLLESIYESL